MDTVGSRLESMLEDFNLMESWTLRYQYIMELGSELPAVAEERRTHDRRVPGCSSLLWFDATREGTLRRIQGWSPSAVPRGLAGLVWKLYDGTAAEPAEPEPDTALIITSLGLEGNLSHTRIQTLARLLLRASQASDSLETP